MRLTIAFSRPWTDVYVGLDFRYQSATVDCVQLFGKTISQVSSEPGSLNDALT